MATQVQFRRGTTGEHSAFRGAVGEVTVDTEKKTVCIHDASTLGGFPLLREDFSNSNLALGSLSSCALKFVNDPDTGVMSTGQDQIQLVTGGVARLTIDSSGTISIPNNLIVSGNLNVTGELDSGNQIALILALG
tara:strand:- start:385 stop:789 length:405 start_codon:yes stop_codon:yes gene_type:complete